MGRVRGGGAHGLLQYMRIGSRGQEDKGADWEQRGAKDRETASLAARARCLSIFRGSGTPARLAAANAHLPVLLGE